MNVELRFRIVRPLKIRNTEVIFLEVIIMAWIVLIASGVMESVWATALGKDGWF